MAEYIEREKVEEMLNRFYFGHGEHWCNALGVAEEGLDAIPAADVRPERHGKWKRSCDGYSYFCSICGEEPDKSGRLLSDFCPWCGAKMDGKDGESDG